MDLAIKMIYVKQLNTLHINDIFKLYYNLTLNCNSDEIVDAYFYKKYQDSLIMLKKYKIMKLGNNLNGN